MLNRLDKLVSAIENHDHFGVQDILSADMIAQNKIPTKYLIGALVIAAENQSMRCFNLIVNYSSQTQNPIAQEYIQAAYSIFNMGQHNKNVSALETTLH